MKFITSAEAAIFKRLGRKILNGFRSVGFIQLLISIVFAVCWSWVIFGNLHLSSVDLILGGGLIIPLLLLIAVLRYKSLWAYGAVLAFFVYSIISNIFEIRRSAQFLSEKHSELIILFAGCPMCDIVTNLELITAAFVAISLMHNRRMVLHYGWHVGLFKKSILAGVLLHLIRFILSII